MPEVFSGKVEFKNSSGQTILVVDSDSDFFQITQASETGDRVMELTNTAALLLGFMGHVDGPRESASVQLDGSIGLLRLAASLPGKAASARLHGSDGKEAIVLDTSNGAAAFIGTSGNEGNIVVRDGEGRDVFLVDGNLADVAIGANGNQGDVVVRNANGVVTIRLDGGSGDVVLSNADCAEVFELESALPADPGTVMVLTGDGRVAVSHAPYDRKVAGVVSGAGGLRPGIVLGRQIGVPGRCPLALAGKVFCHADASYGPIALGDLLTTSPTPGHAMKASDLARAFGAVIGKALAPLASGRSLVPMLVTLQ